MTDNPYVSAFKKCDIVMKGGVTSGIVYPRAVTRLAKEYSFQSIGGTSAGAIAAAITAAAEYRRRQGTDVFAEMDKIPDWLGAPSESANGSNLFNLFQPQRSMAALFRVAAAFLGYSGFARSLRVAAALWFEGLVGALPGLAVIFLLRSSHFFTALVLGGLIAAVGSVLGAVAGVALRALRLPKQRFGLCTGYVEPRPGTPVSLTEWLSNQINTIAGHPEERPLTFGDLRRAGVTLKMLSTCLTLGQPYTFPLDTNEFYFSPEEMRAYFPKSVVDWMVAHAMEPSTHREPVDTTGFVHLPLGDDLPVIVATRCSLSFPLLFCAVPLYALDWTRRRRAATEPANVQRIPGDALGHDEPRRPEVVWFSDGGICSNFPLHLFDSALPRWPTFCLNLRETRADYAYDDPNDHIWLPTSNLGGIAEGWKRWTGSYSAAFSFVGSIVDAARNWTDTLQAIVPGYRDRIAHIYLDSKQGGLNLNMGMAAVHEIAGYGECAAERLADRFLRGTDKGEPTAMTWDNQRWVRYRSTMSVLRGFLSRFATGMKGPEPGERSYEELIVREGNTLPASYRFDEEQREGARDITRGLADLGQEMGDCDLSKGAPRPEPALRVRPQF